MTKKGVILPMRYPTPKAEGSPSAKRPAQQIRQPQHERPAQLTPQRQPGVLMVPQSQRARRADRARPRHPETDQPRKTKQPQQPDPPARTRLVRRVLDPPQPGNPDQPDQADEWRNCIQHKSRSPRPAARQGSRASGRGHDGGNEWDGNGGLVIARSTVIRPLGEFQRIRAKLANA